jgi:putative DNA primase/helicase
LENSTVLSFVDECCAIDPKAMVLRNDLYGAYKEYCGDNGYQPYSRTRFNRELDALSGVTLSQDSTAGNRRVWRGLRLLS